MRPLLYFLLIPTIVLVLIYYIFGPMVFSVVITTILTMLTVGGIVLYIIIKRFIKPFKEKIGVFKNIMKK